MLTSRHAYLILAHDKPEMLGKLVELLDDSRNDIFIHIDGKKPLAGFKACVASRKAKVSFIEPRIKVSWGTLSVVNAEFALLRAACAEGHHDYYHLISGVDLPLKTQDQLHRFFGSRRGEEFVEVYPENDAEANLDISEKTKFYQLFMAASRPVAQVSLSMKLGRNLSRLSRKLQSVAGIRRQFPWKIRKGSQWASLTEGAVEYILGREREILKNFRFTGCPDEFFLQTVLCESPFATNISSDGNLRAIDWTRGKPYTWTANELPELVNSKMLFARKFAPDASDSIKALLSDRQENNSA